MHRAVDDVLLGDQVEGLGDSKIDPKIDTPLAVGAAAGGLAGRQMFSAVASFFGDANIAGAVQAGTLMLVTVGTLLYTLNKEKIATRNVTGAIPCVAIGLVLGISSSFLGIGGGPINLVVLFYFFTMSTKRAAQSSLYIILFSQAASTIAAVAGGVSNLDVALLAGMAVCGILGGIAGRAVNKHIDDAAVDKLFCCLMVAIILISGFNVVRYCG